MPQTQGKAWFRSRTVWVNLLTVMLAALSGIGGEQFVASHPRLAMLVAILIGAVNLALRFVTREPIAGMQQ